MDLIIQRHNEHYRDNLNTWRSINFKFYKISLLNLLNMSTHSSCLENKEQHMLSKSQGYYFTLVDTINFLIAVTIAYVNLCNPLFWLLQEILLKSIMMTITGNEKSKMISLLFGWLSQVGFIICLIIPPISLDLIA